MGRKRDSYFLITAWMFLLVVIIGFSKGFFFRPIYKETSIPSYLVIHGALMVIWYVAYVYQSHLVYKGNIINHRRFGTFWFLFALIITMANLNVILEISSETMNGETSYYDVIRTFENTGGLVVGNLYLTLSGLAFLAIGYYKRNKPHVHKRAMFGVSGLLLNPAFDRFIDPLGLQDIHPLLKFTVIYLFPISLIIYDIVKRKKPYKISVVILIVFLLTLPIIFSLLNAGWGEKLIRFFG